VVLCLWVVSAYVKRPFEVFHELRQTTEQVTDDIRGDPAFLDKLAVSLQSLSPSIADMY
jgi:hypothetical protein